MSNIKEDIRQKLLEKLAWDSREEMEDFDVNLMDGRLILRGTVPSYETIRAIEDSAYSLDGIHSVDNSLLIRYPDDLTAATDEDVKAWIENGIKDHRSLNAAKIDVEVNDSLVTLTGTVDAYWKKRLAEDIAQSATGTAAVQNDIKIESMSKTMDDIIKQDVEKALSDNFNVRAEWITVTVEDGVVTLKGNVPDFNAARAAHVSAAYANGVTDVRDELVVKEL